MKVLKTGHGMTYYKFYVFGVPVPGWLYGLVGIYVPYRFRRVDWRNQ
jgi:hypothetical protein